MPELMNDIKLVTQVAVFGNKRAFDSLLRKYQSQVRRFLLSLTLGDRQLADDLAQETLVKAYLSCDAYQDQGHFTAWIYRIAYRTFLDHRRNLHPTDRLDTAREVASQEASDGTFRYEALYAALATLPERERTALLLFYLKGYAVKEISDIMECGEDAVKKQLQRGREHLRNKLGKDGKGL